MRALPLLVLLLPPLSACGADPAGAAGPGLRLGAVEVVLHPEQPMVVDVTVPVAEGVAVAVEVPLDPGVRAGAAQRDGERVTVRLRGLAPDADHAATLTLTRDAITERAAARFRTPAALPAFEASFPVTGAERASAEYRLFDREITPSADQAALFVVDREGVTRWYLPRNTTLDNNFPVEKAPIRAASLEDGTLAFTQDYDAWRIDELGQAVAHVTAAALGVPALHHDLYPMANGHLLALAYEFQDVIVPGTTELATVCGDQLVEFDWEGNVYWRWSAFEHLDPTRFRDGLNTIVPDPTRPGTGGFDWTHANSVVHRPADDTVLVSLRHQDWVLNIDRATGALRWRLGPEGDLTIADGEGFFHQHAAHWLPDGRLALYDNGIGNPDLPTGYVSRGLILSVDEAAATAAVEWESTGEGYQSLLAGGLEPLVSGGFLITDAFMVDLSQSPPNRARLREVDASGADVWTLEGGSGQLIFRATPVPGLPGEPLPAP